MFKPPVEELFSFLLGEAALTLINEKIAVSLPNLLTQLRRMADNEQNEARLAAYAQALSLFKEWVLSQPFRGAFTGPNTRWYT